MEVIFKIINFLNYLSDWFEKNVVSVLVIFLKIIGGLIIKILEIFIAIIKWLMSFL